MIPLDTSALSQIQSQGHSQSPKFHTVPNTCSNQITLAQVTVQEVDTDERLSNSQGSPGACYPSYDPQSRLGHSSKKLEKILQILKKLHASFKKGIGIVILTISPHP